MLNGNEGKTVKRFIFLFFRFQSFFISETVGETSRRDIFSSVHECQLFIDLLSSFRNALI